MRSHYTCGKCKTSLEATKEHFFPSNLKKVANDLTRLVISQCKSCANQYATQWRSNVKAKGLTRSRKNTLVMAGAVVGTVYVIGPGVPGTPYKIGITSGSNTDKRKASLQTAHWMDLKEVWKSDLLDRADIVEKKLHKHFEKKWVRGEWFNITKDDISDIPELIERFGVEK
jgi:hypothetical protein